MVVFVKGKIRKQEFYSEQEEEAVKAHLAAKFGTDKKLNTFAGLPTPDIRIEFFVSEPMPERNFITVSTLGIGAHRMNAPPENHEAETGPGRVSAHPAALLETGNA
ncbi:MAG: suppressor of fused domain protein [Deltaproteobacteria bacterium]|nr:suppressor of fused domain protein [Deltaproteobacteria bacterium]